MREHVVVFGVDGVRYDTLREARTPTLDTIAGDGFIASLRVNDAAPTISGPGWATIATGVLADRHLIYDNDLTGHRIADYPDFLTRVRASLPGSRTYAIGSWPQLVHETYGGPIFLGGGIMPLGDHPGTEGWGKADELVATDACRVLGGDDITAAFVYFGLPDVVAHREGVTPAYREAVEGSDQRIGKVLHVDVVGGHGGDSEPERTAWIAASGRGVPAQAPEGLEQADVHAHVLHALDIPIKPEWVLAGQPFLR